MLVVKWFPQIQLKKQKQKKQATFNDFCSLKVIQHPE